MDMFSFLPKNPLSLQLSSSIIPSFRYLGSIPFTTLPLGRPGFLLISDTLPLKGEFFACFRPFFQGF